MEGNLVEGEVAKEGKRAKKRLAERRMPKKAKRTGVEEQAVHVGITDPNYYRRQVLGIVIQTIEMLKYFEEYKNIRDEKRTKMVELNRVLLELKRLNSKLDVSSWPYVELKMRKTQQKPMMRGTVLQKREALERVTERQPRPALSARHLRISNFDYEIDTLKKKLMEL